MIIDSVDRARIAHALTEQAEDQEIMLNQAMEGIAAILVRDPKSEAAARMLVELDVIEQDIVANRRLAVQFSDEDENEDEG